MKTEREYAGTYKVRVGDINYGGHMGNDKSLIIFHDARIHYLESRGFSESDIGGPGIIMGDAHVYFKKEVFLGDELTVYIHIENLKGISFDMHYDVLRGDQQVFYGNTKIISFDYSQRKVTKIPDSFLNSI